MNQKNRKWIPLLPLRYDLAPLFRQFSSAKIQSTSVSPRSHPSRLVSRIALVATCLIALQATPTLRAADVTWSSTGTSTAGGDGNWSGGTTWWNGSSAVSWTAGDNAAFTAAGNTTVNSNVNVNRITFSNSADNISIVGGAGALALTSGITAINTADTTALTYTISESINVAANQTWAVTNGGTTGTVNLVVSGALSGNSTITKLGGGTLTLSASNSRAGQLQMGLNSPSTTAGTVRLLNNNALGTSAATILWENDGILELATNGLSIASSSLINNRNSATDFKRVYRLDLAGTNTGTISGSFDIRNNNSTTTFDVGTDDTLTLSGNFSNAANTGSFTKAGAGTVVLTGSANTLSGGIVISAGTLQVGNGGTTGTLNASANAVTNNGALVFNRSDNITVGNAIRGSGSLTKNGTGTLTLTNASTYTGATTIADGELALSGSGKLSSSTALNLSGATSRLDVSGVTDSGSTNGSLAGAPGSVINLGGKNLNVGGDNTSTTFAGILTNTGVLTKSGAGTLTLSGNNTYTGATVVSAGSMIVNGSTAAGSILTVNSGATLGGSGTIGGATTISGIHSPGNSPGIQTFNSSLTYAGTPTVQWELTANTTTQGDPTRVFDQIIVGGNLDFAVPTTLTLNFALPGSTVDWSNSLWDSDITGTSGWLVYDVAGTLSSFGNLAISVENWADGSDALFNTVRAGSSFSLYNDGVSSDIYLNYAVPEPSTYALLMLAAAGLGTHVVRRRRNR